MKRARSLLVLSLVLIPGACASRSLGNDELGDEAGSTSTEEGTSTDPSDSGASSESTDTGDPSDSSGETDSGSSSEDSTSSESESTETDTGQPDTDSGPLDTDTGAVDESTDTGGETCGNNVHDPGEECDDGNRNDADACNNQCQITKDPMCDGDFAVLPVAGRDAFWVDGPEGEQFCDRVGAPNQDPDWQGPGWYRFGEWGGDLLSMEPPIADYACGTTYGGWITESAPSPVEGVVAREVCFATEQDPCAWQVEINMLNCWEFWAYELVDAPTCDLRYCTVTLIPP